MRICTNCGQSKDHFDFPSNSNGRIKYPRTTCKDCYSKIVYHKYAEKMIEKFPNKYKDCDNCYRVYAKSLRRCPECKTVNSDKVK